LPETLRHLSQQDVSESQQWEIVVIDNASTDDTAEAAIRYCPAAIRDRLRVVREETPGLSHARMRGVKEAGLEIVSFIDDDNWVCSSWVRTVSEIFGGAPEIGAAGGPSEGHFTSEPPTWFAQVEGYFAVGPQHAMTGDITSAQGTLLWGAGLCIRKEAWEKLFQNGFQFLLSDRKGKELSTGGDTEVCFALREMGWRFWYDERLELKHAIPMERLRWDYFLKLARGMGSASVWFNLILSAYNRPPFDKLPAWKKTWLFHFLKTVFHLIRVKSCNRGLSEDQCEGWARSRDLALIQGHISSLWELFPRYGILLRQIRSASWRTGALRD